MPSYCFVPNSPFTEYAALISRGWQYEAKFRPTAQEFRAELECMWKNVGQSVVFDTDIVPDIIPLDRHQSMRTLSLHKSFMGARTSAKINYTTLAADIEPILNDPSYEGLDNSGAPWLLVTANYPHIVVRTTPTWIRLTGYKPDVAIGKSLAGVMSGAKTDSSALENFTSSLSVSEFSHCVATLYKATFSSMDSPVYSLFSIHGYPVYRRIQIDRVNSVGSTDSRFKSDDLMDDPSNYVKTSFNATSSSTLDSSSSSPNKSSISFFKSTQQNVQVSGVAYFAILFSELKELSKVEAPLPLRKSETRRSMTSSNTQNISLIRKSLTTSLLTDHDSNFGVDSTKASDEMKNVV